MRNYLLRLALGLALIMLAINLPLRAKAEDKLTIPLWDVEAELLENGDLSISEDITFDFNDKFNGVFREVILDGTSGISEIGVQEVLRNELRNYQLVEDASKGDSDVFLVKEKKDRVIIQIFAPSQEQERVFRIRYRIKNVATRYNDTGELYYKFLGKENETPIDLFKVNIKLPPHNNESKIKVYAHGPLHGKISKKNNTYTLSVTDVPTDTFIEGRILFPTELIPLSENIKNIDSYNSIVAEEEAYRNKQVEKQQRKEAGRSLMEKVSLLVSGLGLVIFFVFFTLFRRDREIYRPNDFVSIPADCTPAVAAKLTNTYISMNTIFATILDLYRKGYLVIKGVQDTIDFNEKKQDYMIKKIKEPDEALLNHERTFCTWFFDEIGDGNTVSTKDIKNYGKKHSSAFNQAYNTWKMKIKEDAIKKGYYDDSKKKYGIFLLIFSIILYVVGITTAIYESIYSLLAIICATVLFIYSLFLINRLTDEGYRLYKQWIEFKKRMNKNHRDLSTEDIPDRADSSLIYALALEAIHKPINIDVNKEYPMEGFSFHGWFFWYLLFVNEKDNPFQSSMTKAFQGTVVPISNGDFSDGGFSVGGGGGAGGGGAGGF